MSKTEALPMAEKAYSYEHLPLTPYKYQIAHHFGYANQWYFFNKKFFKTILPQTTFTLEDLKGEQRLPPALAREVYETYQITKLKGIHEH